MIGETILHYPSEEDEPLVHKILEEPGEVLLRLSLHTEVDKTKACSVERGGFALRNIYKIGEIK
jgi:hypothetical protein